MYRCINKIIITILNITFLITSSASEQTISNLQEQLRIKERENNDLKTQTRSLKQLLENAQKDLQERDRQTPPAPSQPPTTDSTDSAVRPRILCHPNYHQQLHEL